VKPIFSARLSDGGTRRNALFCLVLIILAVPVADSARAQTVSADGRLTGAAGNDLAFSQDGEVLMTASSWAVRLWNVSSLVPKGPEIRFAPKDPNVLVPFYSLARLAADETVFTVERVKETEAVVRWNGQTGQRLKGPFQVEMPAGLPVAHDGTLFIGITPEGSAGLYESTDGRMVRPLHPPLPGSDRPAAQWAAFSADGSIVVTREADLHVSKFRTFEVPTGRQVGEPVTVGVSQYALERSAAITGDGRRLAVATDEGVELIDLRTSRRLLKLEEPRVSAFFVSGDGSTAAVASPRALLTWNLRTGEVTARHNPVKAWNGSLCSAGSRGLFFERTHKDGCRVFLVDLAAGKTVWRVQGPQNPNVGGTGAISADGKRFAVSWSTPDTPDGWTELFHLE
jgi:hypothetical protein